MSITIFLLNPKFFCKHGLECWPEPIRIHLSRHLFGRKIRCYHYVIHLGKKSICGRNKMVHLTCSNLYNDSKINLQLIKKQEASQLCKYKIESKQYHELNTSQSIELRTSSLERISLSYLGFGVSVGCSFGDIVCLRLSIYAHNRQNFLSYSKSSIRFKTSYYKRLSKWICRIPKDGRHVFLFPYQT